MKRSDKPRRRAAPKKSMWPLDPGVIFLNHGSFGCCPKPVLEFQRDLRDRLERQPVQFLGRELEGLLDAARASLAAFVAAQPDDLVFVHNATAGVNTVLRSFPFKPGDEILITTHVYGSCRNAASFVAEQHKAVMVEVAVPFPVKSSDEILDAILARVTARTRLAMIEHITSPTALIFPIERIVRALAERGVDTLVDGAHAPGMLPLDLDKLGAAYYTGNCHKWLCAPKGSAFLHVRRDRQDTLHPLVISHGGGAAPRQGRSRFVWTFQWGGTLDPTAWLSVPEAIRCVGAMVPGGWPEVMRRNHDLACEGRKIMCTVFGVPEPCPATLIGSMATILLPDSSPEPDAIYTQ